MRLKAPIIFATTLFFLLGVDLKAQTSANPGKSLYDELFEMDSVVFANVYTCNTAKNETFFTGDIEFYHDKGGLTKSRETLVEQLRNNFCGEGKTKLRRELIKGSLKVYPIKNFGAVQLGEHRFYVTENGNEILSGVAKFIHVWKYENGEWRISRVFSYDHNPPYAKTSATPGELYQTIASNDSAMFRAFNDHSVDELKTFFQRISSFITTEVA